MDFTIFVAIIEMADFIPTLDIDSKLARKQFAQKYVGSDKLLIQALYVDDQRFRYVYYRYFLFYFYLIDQHICIFSFDCNGIISLHSGSHGLNVKNSVAVWSWIGVNGVPNVLKKLDCRLDTSQYKILVSAHVFSYCSGRQFIHDYFPVHTAKSVKDFISCNRIPWPAFEAWPKKSGDLMPLETVWKQIVSKVNGKLVFNEDDLWSEYILCKLIWINGVNCLIAAN